VKCLAWANIKVVLLGLYHLFASDVPSLPAAMHMH
jgi:hypothetical protein